MTHDYSHRPFLVLLLGLAPLFGCGGSSGDQALSDSGELLARFEEDRRHHDPVAFVEVDLGEFFVTQIDEQGLQSVRFHLYAVVHCDQEQEVANALEARQTRMRDRVIATVRDTAVEHLTEPTLAWVKSELRPAVNRSLKVRVIRDVVFTDYSFESS